MSEKEVKERLNYFKTISILYGDTFAMSTELLKQLQKDIETVLQLLKQKDNKINKVIEYCNETIEFKDAMNERYDDCYDILKILEE